MTLSHDETKGLIELVLAADPERARDILNARLKIVGRGEPEFYAGIIEHGPTMKYTSDQWFDLLSRVPTRVLRDESKLMNKLSETQRQNLPPATL